VIFIDFAAWKLFEDYAIKNLNIQLTKNWAPAKMLIHLLYAIDIYDTPGSSAHCLTSFRRVYKYYMKPYNLNENPEHARKSFSFKASHIY